MKNKPEICWFAMIDYSHAGSSGVGCELAGPTSRACELLCPSGGLLCICIPNNLHASQSGCTLLLAASHLLLSKVDAHRATPRRVAMLLKAAYLYSPNTALSSLATDPASKLALTLWHASISTHVQY